MLWDRKNVWEKNWLQNGGQKKVRYFKKIWESCSKVI
jgi:hypothetical protein